MLLMVTPDVNVLVAASRSDHPHHRKALSWLEQALAAGREGDGVDLLPMVVAGFLRLVTNRKVFVRPTPISDAVDFVEALLASPGVAMAELGREWPLLRDLCRNKKLAGNGITDAWIAAAVKTAGDHLITFDRDFTGLLHKKHLTVLTID